MKVPGVLHLKEPAAGLFVDFAGLCRAATRFHYEKWLGLSVQPQDLVPPAVSIEDDLALAEDDQIIRRFFRNLDPAVCRTSIGSDEVTRRSDPQVSLANLHFARQRMEQMQPQMEELGRQYAETDKELRNATCALHLLQAGFVLEASDFGLPCVTPGFVQFLVDTTFQEQRRLSVKLMPYENEVRIRLSSALDLLQEAARGGQIEGAEMLHREAVEMLGVLLGLGGVLGTLHKVRYVLSALEVLARHRNRQQDLGRVNAVMATLRAQLRALLNEIQAGVRDLRYPFSHEWAHHLVATGLQEELTDDPAGLPLQSRNQVDRLVAFYRRALSRLILIVERVEAHV